MFDSHTGRNDFIAYAVARYVTHLANASPSDYQNAVTIAQTLANKLEMSSVAPWPRESWVVQPPAPAAVPPPGAVLVPVAAPPVQGQSSAAADNTAKLLANLPPGTALPGQPAQTGAVVGESGGPKVGTVANPAQAGAVIAAHGEVQGHKEQVIGPTITTPGIVSDVQAVRQPGVVPGTPTP